MEKGLGKHSLPQAHSRTKRHFILGCATIVLAPIATAFIGSPAYAHHGWPSFDTENLLYISGSVSSDGIWGNPHSYFDITLDTSLPADAPDLPLPVDLQHPEDSVRVHAALAYTGSRSSLQIVIAPPAWTGPWGLDRPLRIGERFQAVGYINRRDEGLFRPVVFWYGDDAIPVNQVLGSTLPVRAPFR
jgi:hypothetical protein